MKKLKLTKLEFAELILGIGKQELSLLKGGYGINSNTNNTSGCICPTNNDIIINSNTHEGCKCNCN